MEVDQNLLEDIQGKWRCTKTLDQLSRQIEDLDFALLISENLISRMGGGEEFWPGICNFELVGSIKDGYFFREDGCFMQVKEVSEEKLEIELSHKNLEGALKSYVFHFEKDTE